AVSLLVRLYLVAPPTGIGLRPRAVFWATMPETSINEYEYPRVDKSEICSTACSWHTPIDAVSEPEAMDRRPQCEFTWCIPLWCRLHSPPHGRRRRGHARHFRTSGYQVRCARRTSA